MADAAMLSPVPRKAFIEPPAWSGHLPQTPRTPSKVQDFTTARAFWYDEDDATHELRGVWSAEVLPHWVPAFQARALSAASTSAGPTPSLDDTSPTHTISPPLSPECIDLAQADAVQCSSAVSEKTSWMSERKVFVGGVPQHIDQASLYKMFNKIARVKKAWLQLVHADGTKGPVSGMKKHRGFGFVIFFDKQAVEQLLGRASSRMMCFDDNLKVEVKRAVGKNSTAFATPEAQSPDDSGLCNSGLSAARSPGPQTPWQAPQFSKFDISKFDNLPYVPPFPEVCSTPWTGSSPESLHPGALQLVPAQRVSTSDTQVMPVPMPQLVPSEPALPDETPTDMQFLTGVLLNGYVGVRPRNSEELESMLLQAMPESYDD